MKNLPKGWRGMRRTIRQLWRDVQAFKNIRITRSGTTDSVTVGSDSVLINVRNLPARSDSGVSGPQLPWTVRSNGDSNVTVGPGEILSWPDGEQYPLTLGHFASYAGGTVEVTGSGVIYGSIDAALSLDVAFGDTWTDSNGDTTTIDYLRLIPDTAGSITVSFAGTLPVSNTVFHWEIAQVSLSNSNVASVDKQVLTHNPALWSYQSVP